MGFDILYKFLQYKEKLMINEKYFNFPYDFVTMQGIVVGTTNENIVKICFFYFMNILVFLIYILHILAL